MPSSIVLLLAVEQNYELIAQHAGELFVGGEYETDIGKLTKQLSTSRLLKKAVELGASAELYARPLLDLLSAPGARWKVGPVCIYGAFEGRIQFIRQTEEIVNASLYPVTSAFLIKGYH